MKFCKYFQSDVVMEHINFIARDNSLLLETKDWHKSVFSQNCCSAGKGPFMAGKAKNVHQRYTFPGGGGSGVRDMAQLTLGNLEAKFSDMSFALFKAYFMQIGHCHL